MEYVERIRRAVDYIEEHLSEKMTVKEVAGVSYLSPYHFYRVFQGVVGDSLGEYIRKRRLTVAADRLVNSNTKIINIAFDSGFDSHEAFTRAFRKQFGITPAKFRANQKFIVAFRKKPLTENKIKHLKEGVTMEPKIVKKPAFTIVGMDCQTTLKNNQIPELWQKFMRRFTEIENPKNPGVYYGICVNDPSTSLLEFTEDTVIREIVGVEVFEKNNIPEGMLSYDMPESKYAVFTHKGPLSNLRTTYDYIYGTWLDNEKVELSMTSDFELYDERFTGPEAQNSELDIYVPIK